MTDEEIKKEYCPMCGATEAAALDHHNGGWTEIDCEKCDGGRFYLWVRSDKPGMRSITISNL
jgi:hypothetical protein